MTDGKVIHSEFNLGSAQRLKKHPLILDGAMGSLLIERNFPSDKNLWTSIVNITHPEAVRSIHKEYIDAGADIITTNTFRTNPFACKDSGLKISQKEFVGLSVALAIDARAGRDVIIAGSNAPAEDCYQRKRTLTVYELEKNHIEHITQLWENGVDLIWNETQSHLDEIHIICEFCSANMIPYAVNLYTDSDLNILSGESLDYAIKFIASFNPQAIGFNCIELNIFERFIEKFPLPYSWGFYFNCGSGDPESNQIQCGVKPSDLAEQIKPLLRLNPLFAGSCCGSNPAHTKAVKELFNEIY